MVFDKIKRAFSDSASGEGFDDEYLEIDLGQEEKENKVLIKLFVLKDYDDVNEILNSLRQGYTIAIINITTLRKKDSIELKRAVSKIKKTTDALEGSIAGFGENTIIVAPSFARIDKDVSKPKEEKKSRWD
ncbi:cell division protein SepF [Candidatus Pacearchaeota archaeon]|nr:cell division protein SepF [Candidatus Pacearchaeota archaeon]